MAEAALAKDLKGQLLELSYRLALLTWVYAMRRLCRTGAHDSGKLVDIKV